MKRRKINNKAQLKISFGMIFTIILIIFFLAFVIYSINKNKIHYDEIIAGKFTHDLKIDIQEVRNHEQAVIEVTYKVPENISHVYFQAPDDSEENIGKVYFNESGYLAKDIEGINWEYTTKGNSSIYFNVSNTSQTVTFFLIKGYQIPGVIINENGEIPIIGKSFYAGAPQNHGTYQEILSKGQTGEYTILFNINFQERPLGKWETYSEFRSSWNGASWGNRGEEAEVVLDPADKNNKAMLIVFPFWDPSVNETWICWDSEGRCGDEEGKRIYFTNGYSTDRDPSLVNTDGEPTFTRHRKLLDNVGTGSGGLSFSIPLGREYNEVYLSYNIKHEPDWAAPAGGKLPGLQPAVNKCPACAPTDCMDQSGNKYKYELKDGEWIYYEDTDGRKGFTEGDLIIEPDGIADDFSTRHMFHKNDHISYYYYDFDKVNKCGDSGGVRDSAKIFDGDWHNIVYRVRMNDPGVANGVTETWIDGENKGAITNHLFRTQGSDFGIGKIAFDNFFGGSGMPCSDVERSFASSCERGEWWPHLIDNWVPACAIDPNDPCAGYRKFADGSPQSYWGNKKTEYIHFDDIVAYIPY